ncbi:MAG: tetratricopeptide repeat protein [Gallionellaceae bacterium]|nr:MAG: tetratricopeptide repeat protein [Gallionellaceae bacterium]
MLPRTKTPWHGLPDKMNSIHYKIILLPLLLGACAHAPQAGRETPANSAKSAVQAGNAAAEKKPEPPPALPNIALDDRMLFEFLLGDIAMQRGRPELAAQAYWDLAKTTRDPRVARRAAQLAFESRQMDKSVEAFALWQELDPAAPLAKQMLVSLLLSGGKLQEARPHVERLLTAEPGNVAHAFMLINSLLVRAPDKVAAQNWLVEVARPYPKVAEAHWAVAQVATAAGNKELALAEIHQAVLLRPEWDMAVVFEAQLLQPGEPKKALELLRAFLEKNPASKDVRLFYARALLEQKQYAESRTQFQQLLAGNPENVELAFAVALLSLQMGELERAEKELHETLAKGKKDAGTVHYYLGQLSEAKKDDATALAQYHQVSDGEYVYAARLREAYLLKVSGKVNESFAVLRSAPVTNSQQRVTLVLIESQMLRETGQFEAAYKILAEALEKQPNHPQLLFEMAMAADKLGKIELFEQALRKLLQVAPDHAQAYNALGYSYLERNIKIEEGMQLVEKAYQLAPDDAAIADSVGWGYYRLGKLEKSAEFLRRAFSANPDPEIAMHLGEVLWVQGSKDEAQKIWQDTLKAHPNNEPLRALIKKFIP